jgi:alpha-1,3-rhamnosyl/mannosyltransferase
VIASRAVLEVAGDAAIYADSAEELATAMREVLGNAHRTPEWRERSLTRARQFTWERCARETYAVYGEAQKRFRKRFQLD